MPMSPVLWSDLPFKQRTAANDWGGVHGIWHQIIANVAARASKPYQVYPLVDGVGSPAWMRAHAQEHINANRALGIAGPPNLTDYDLTNRDDWANFHFIHAQESNRLRAAAGVA